MKDSYLLAVCQEQQDVNPLFNLLGAKLAEAADGTARITLPLSSCLAQGMGVVAGGILATLADEAMAHAAMSTLGRAAFLVTTEMNIRYLRSADPKSAGSLIGTGSVVKAGHNIITASAEVRDEAGTLLATAGGSFFVTERKRNEM